MKHMQNIEKKNQLGTLQNSVHCANSYDYMQKFNFNCEKLILVIQVINEV